VKHKGFFILGIRFCISKSLFTVNTRKKSLYFLWSALEKNSDHSICAQRVTISKHLCSRQSIIRMAHELTVCFVTLFS